MYTKPPRSRLYFLACIGLFTKNVVSLTLLSLHTVFLPNNIMVPPSDIRLHVQSPACLEANNCVPIWLIRSARSIRPTAGSEPVQSLVPRLWFPQRSMKRLVAFARGTGARWGICRGNDYRSLLQR